LLLRSFLDFRVRLMIDHKYRLRFDKMVLADLLDVIPAKAGIYARQWRPSGCPFSRA
jgi:hypothetical protein